MDRQKEERERGVTIACTTKEFFTEKWHYTIIDAPGHRDFIKNMITGASQADVAMIMVPCDGNCDTAGYKQSRYDEVSNEMKSMLVKVGWKKDMVEKNVPFLPISGWMGDNLLKPEDSAGKP